MNVENLFGGIPAELPEDAEVCFVIALGFVEFTALSASDMRRVAEFYGGVGEIGASVYDAGGRPCAKEYAERVVSENLADVCL